MAEEHTTSAQPAVSSKDPPNRKAWSEPGWHWLLVLPILVVVREINHRASWGIVGAFLFAMGGIAVADWVTWLFRRPDDKSDASLNLAQVEKEFSSFTPSASRRQETDARITARPLAVAMSPNDGEWYVIHAGKEVGPLSLAELIGKAAVREIEANDLVKKTGGLWQKAGDIDFLQQQFLLKQSRSEPSPILHLLQQLLFLVRQFFREDSWEGEKASQQAPAPRQETEAARRNRQEEIRKTKTPAAEFEKALDFIKQHRAWVFITIATVFCLVAAILLDRSNSTRPVPGTSRDQGRPSDVQNYYDSINRLTELRRESPERRKGRPFPQERQYQILERFKSKIDELDHAIKGERVVPDWGVIEGPKPPPERVAHLQQLQARLARRALELAK